MALGWTPKVLPPIEIQRLETTGIKCDSCGWEDQTIQFKDYKHWLNRNCDFCGDILLTQDEVNKAMHHHKVNDVINAWANKWIPRWILRRLDINNKNTKVIEQKREWPWRYGKKPLTVQDRNI